MILEDLISNWQIRLTTKLGKQLSCKKKISVSYSGKGTEQNVFNNNYSNYITLITNLIYRNIYKNDINLYHRDISIYWRLMFFSFSSI